MKKLARNSLALGTATLIVTAGLSFAANGADATKSYSTGRFLSGSIGSTNLDNLAQLKGVTAANPGNAGPNTNPLSLTLLSAIPINLPGGLNLNLADFLSPGNGSAGVANQFADAQNKGKARGASGAVSNTGAVLAPGNGQFPSDAKISLSGGLLDPINDDLAGVDLTVGALSSSTVVDTSGPTRDYQIGELKLDVSVPLLGDLVGDLTNALDPLNSISDITISPAQLCSVLTTGVTVPSAALLNQLDSLGLDAVRTLLDAVLNPLVGTPITEVNLCDSSNPLLSAVFDILTGPVISDLIEVNITGLDNITTGLTNLSSGGVDLDLSTGKITLDLGKILQAAGVDLNNLPPNTDIVSFITSDLISGKITSVLNSAITNVVAKIADVNVSVSVAGQAVPLELDDLTGPITDALVTTLTSVTDAVQQIGAPIDDLLGELAPDLAQIVKLTGNNQSTSKTPTLSEGTVGTGNVGTAAVGDYYRTSALKIDLLTNVANVDLAASEAAVLAADVVDDDDSDQAAAAADDADAPADNDADADSSDADSAADAQADANADTVADADAQADADVTTTLPSAGAPNLLPFWLLGIALLLFGAAVLVNEKRRLSQI